MHARYFFLASSLGANVFMLFMGLGIYHWTNSLTVQVDAIGTGTDALCLMVNMGFEYAKAQATSKKAVLGYDLIGGLISLLSLVFVAVYGLVLAMGRAQESASPEFMVEHPTLMIFYSIFGIAFDIFILMIWCRLRDLIIPPDQRTRDVLNVISSLMHVVADGARELTLICTTAWLMFSSYSTTTPWEDITAQVHGDVSGCILLCACILVTAGWLLIQSCVTYSHYEKECDEEAAKDYGSTAQGVLA